MVLRLASALQETQRPASVSSRVCDCLKQVRLGDVVGTGASHQDSAGPEHFQSAEVELLIAAESRVEVLAGFGKGRRIKDDSVVLAARGSVVLEQVKGIGLDPLDF